MLFYIIGLNDEGALVLNLGPIQLMVGDSIKHYKLITFIINF